MLLNKKKYNQLDIRTLIGVASLLLLAILVMSAIDSRKGARISGLAVEIEPLEGESYMIQTDEVKSIIYEGYRRDVEDLTVEGLDIKAVEALLENEPFIADADVFVNADDRLDIQITQASAAARVMDEKGRSYYLTSNLKPFPISKHASARVVVFSGDIPVFDGNVDSLSNTQKGIKKFIEILEDNVFAEKMIEQIHVESNGTFLIQPKMGRFKFEFGQPINLNEKILKMEMAYKEVLPSKGWNKYKRINLSIEDQIICER